MSLNTNRNQLDRAPIGNVKRTDYIADDGYSVLTEWEPWLPHFPMPNGQTVAISGIRPDGIGMATAQGFLNKGYRIFACDRNGDAGEEAVEYLRQQGGDVSFVEADVSTEEGVELFMKKIGEKTPVLNALVCNAGSAGVPARDNWLTTTGDEFITQFKNNLLSVALTVQGGLRHFFMEQDCKGSVTLLGTHNGQRGFGQLGQFAYGTCKAALTSLLSTFVAEVGKKIRMNLVNPGIIETNSLNWQKRRDANPNWGTLEGGYNPTGTLGNPEDVANLIVFLASEQAKFVNGAVIDVDGGLTATGICHPRWDCTNFRESYVAEASLTETDNQRDVA